MKTKTHLLLSLLLLAGATVARAESVVAQTAPFRLDLRPSPRKVEPGASESLAFGDRWADASRSATTVNVSLDGADYATLPGSEGTVDWTPDRGGLFTFTHTALDADGASFGDVYQASFVIDNFPFGDGDVSVLGWDGVYDGEAHGISVSSTVDGATVKYATAKAGPYSSTKPARKDAGTTTVWYLVEAPFYLPVTNSAAISISSRSRSVSRGFFMSFLSLARRDVRVRPVSARCVSKSKCPPLLGEGIDPPSFPVPPLVRLNAPTPPSAPCQSKCPQGRGISDCKQQF